ncbi:MULTISPECIES: hypothetical protein [Bradyrhizobium]|uniref:hypothetical protein n=1 Tax=Bradyrhizobium TaxID=374 RepID=UPI0009ED2383|nr:MULTISPECIES: hypothetical protein [Bradyrhizobium]
MARSSAGGSIKTTIMILALAALPALSFAQTTGGSAGSSGSSVGPTGGSVGSTGGSVGSTGGFANSPVPPPGLNSLGTAQSSGPGSGVTTGTGGGEAADAAVNAENRQLDRKIKSICRGC